MRRILHKQVYKPGAGGGTLNTTLCGRMRVRSDGMNIAENDAQVTCKICLRLLAASAVPPRV